MGNHWLGTQMGVYARAAEKSALHRLPVPCVKTSPQFMAILCCCVTVVKLAGIFIVLELVASPLKKYGYVLLARAMAQRPRLH